MLKLNYMQEKIADMGAEHILKGKLDPFEFSGKPGTGKSVVLHEIQKRSGVPLNKVAPMSYVGQAAIVMRLKGFSNARTICSWLYDTSIRELKDENGNTIYNEYFATPESEFVFIPKSLHDVNVIMIDEGGTTPYHMKEHIESHGLPIIVAGDLNQLPPVKDSPAYLYDTRKVHVLTEIMRQQKDSSITYLAERVLNNLPIHNGFYGDSLVIYDDQVTNDMILNSDMILSGTNATRDRINTLVRKEILKYNSDLPNYGEKVICRNNDWKLDVNGIGLANGLVGTVANQIDISEFKNNVFYIDFKPDLFNGVFQHIGLNYPYFIAPCKIKSTMKFSKYDFGYRFDYAYCTTVHLAQGSQARNVLYFEEFCSPTIQNRVNYTAITRASNSIIYVKKKRNFYFNN